MKKALSRWLICILSMSACAWAGPSKSRPASEGSDLELRRAALLADVEPTAFKKAAQSDKNMRIDASGRAHYVCQALPAQVGPDTTPYTSTALYPLSQTFLLHSRPGAAKVIYLDFTGHVTTGTSWNTTYAAGADITTPAYDTEGNPSTFSASEQAQIQEIWRRISEDYAAWNIDVTTEDPGLEAIRRTSSSDNNYGVRCVFGGSNTDWLGSGAGGIAYVGAFGYTVSATVTTNDIPAFIFPSALGNSASYVAYAASHEIGHTLGLYHSSQTDGTEYYSGHSDWAPIMGAGYDKSVVQWTKGDYPLSNNSQDQITLITNLIPRLADEHANTASGASVVTGETLSAGGVITDSTDTDWFKISAGQGTVNISGLAASPSANLKLSLSLVDDSGNVLATGTSSGMNSNLSVPVVGGNYYIVVDGVGTGNALSGYTDYSSIGRFSLSGSWTPFNSTNKAPIVRTTGTTPTSGRAPLTVSFVGNNSYDPDGLIVSYLWNFGDGDTSTLSNVTHTYSAAGTYNASLTVTDNSGTQSTTPVTIVVTALPPQNINSANISSMAISWVNTTPNAGHVSCTIKVVDQTGRALPRAVVYLTTTGFISGSAIVTTDSTGTGIVKSAKMFSSVTGSTTFTVKKIVLSGYTYDFRYNSVTSVTYKRPDYPSINK
jgi:PKD repeat protein